MKSPIEQHMFGHGGLFRQENVEKRRVMSVREWAELCAKEELRAPGVDDVGLHARANASGRTRRRTRRSAKRESETAEPDREAHAIKEEEEEASLQASIGTLPSSHPRRANPRKPRGSSPRVRSLLCLRSFPSVRALPRLEGGRTSVCECAPLVYVRM